MIKCEVIEQFSLNEYGKIKIVRRKSIDTYGKLYIGDVFECDEKMAKYLTGNNEKGKTVVKIIEVKPEKNSKK